MNEVVPPSRAFVLGLADGDGYLDAAALFDLGAAVGLSDTSIRLTLRRLDEAGLLDVEGRGRKAVIMLTEAGLAARAPDLGWTALAYRLDRGLLPWDGRWHLVSFAIPESERVGRDALRSYLVELIGAQLAGGLYASHYDWEPWVRAFAERHHLTPHLAILATDELSIGDAFDPRDIAERLWPLGDLDRSIGEFLERWRPLAVSPPDDLAEAARAAFAASASFEELARRDPQLPSELAPERWRGREVRDVYRTLLQAVSDRHADIARANVFAAYLDVLEQTESMTDPEFDRWLWSATRPG
ncbi:MAG: PaaX family transcriptional regulator C-terminal domain-containing protein [Actinomycetota bacterium]